MSVLEKSLRAISTSIIPKKKYSDNPLDTAASVGVQLYTVDDHI